LRVFGVIGSQAYTYCEPVSSRVSSRMARQEFWDRLDRARDCWLWTGAKDPKGYAVVSVDGRLWKAHRYAWSLVNGRELPAGSRISQLCGNQACCNPEHRLSASGSRSPGRASGPAGLDRWSNDSPACGSFGSRSGRSGRPAHTTG
jgi:hypothetical protein